MLDSGDGGGRPLLLLLLLPPPNEKPFCSCLDLDSSFFFLSLPFVSLLVFLSPPVFFEEGGFRGPPPLGKKFSKPARDKWEVSNESPVTPVVHVIDLYLKPLLHGLRSQKRTFWNLDLIPDPS